MVTVSTISLTLTGPALSILIKDFNTIFHKNEDLEKTSSSLPKDHVFGKYIENIEKYTKENIHFKESSEQKEKNKNEKKLVPLNLGFGFDKRSNYIYFSRNSKIIINFNCNFLQHNSFDPIISNFVGYQSKALLFAVFGSNPQEIEDCRLIANSFNSNFIHSELHTSAFAQMTETRNSNVTSQRHIKLSFIQDLKTMREEPFRNFRVLVLIINDKQTVFDAKYKKALSGLENDNISYFEIIDSKKISDYTKLFMNGLLDEFTFSDKNAFTDEMESYFTTNSA